MEPMAILLLITNVLTLVWAIRLLGRQPNRRLRYLVLVVSIVSLSQTVLFVCHLQGRSLIEAATVFAQCTTSMASIAAVYLLWVEIRDRHRTDQMLRLAEHQNQVTDGRNMRRVARATGNSTQA